MEELRNAGTFISREINIRQSAIKETKELKTITYVMLDLIDTHLHYLGNNNNKV